MIRFRLLRFSPFKHCQMALGSLSNGSTAPPPCCARCKISPPAITKGSLLAMATVLPCANAASVGARPMAPTSPLITRSASGMVASSHSPSSPQTTSTPGTALCTCVLASLSRTQIFCGCQRRACTISFSILVPPPKPTASYPTPKFSSTLKHVSPIDPVQPRTTIFFLLVSHFSWGEFSCCCPLCGHRCAADDRSHCGHRCCVGRRGPARYGAPPVSGARPRP